MNKDELITLLKERGIKDDVLEVIIKVDRKKFILEEDYINAYEDHPLAIGYGQTISQPYTVAFMLQNLELKKGDKVLEIGTGSGWNAALMSELVGEKGKIYTAEIIKQLYDRSKARLEKYKNIICLYDDASRGISEFAPYDKIIFTAAPLFINESIKDHLNDRGIILAPVGQNIQRLIKFVKKGNSFEEVDLGYFIFVPLIDSGK